ncbi:MAG TPA: DUF58 domain-containing protein [Actinomycetaceae bacterium]|nr:DUF58 domain-containing protein [Actinomycetaceae bacterium]
MTAQTAENHRWFPLTQLTSSLLLGVGLLVAGALLGRADLAALGVAPLLMATWAWHRRPRAPLGVTLRAAGQLTADRELAATLDVTAPAGMPTLSVRSSGPGTRTATALVHVPESGARQLTVSTASVRTGENSLFRVDAIGLGTGHCTAGEVTTVGPASVLVLPGWRPLDRLPLPWRLQGMVGPHSSRRIGDGTELHDVALFRPGDRLRRIDWRTSARRGMQGGQLHDLYVRRTQAPAEATVMLVIDSRDEVGPDVTTWSGGRQILRSDATSLDIAREAAASLARAYLDAGDRVGLADLGRRQRPVRPSGGRRHLDRIVRRLALAVPDPTPRPRVRPPVLPSGALVVVLSTFLDDEALSLALTWRHSGHRVVAVDVLPPLDTAHLTGRVLMAYRMVEMERTDRLTVLRRGGVEVARWAGAPAVAAPGIGGATTSEVGTSGLAVSGSRTGRSGASGAGTSGLRTGRSGASGAAISGPAQIAALARGRHGAPR